MTTVLTIFHVLICVFLVGVVLLQSGRAGGMGVLSGAATQTVFGGRGAGSFLQTMTAVCAVLFMVTCATLSYLASATRDRALRNAHAAAAVVHPATPAPAPVTPPEPAMAPVPAETAPTTGTPAPAETAPVAPAAANPTAPAEVPSGALEAPAAPVLPRAPIARPAAVAPRAAVRRAPVAAPAEPAAPAAEAPAGNP